ncbi:hypothetical protein KTD13_09580 [Burkholderia multivorans]|uniref:hypothetical protein n=1 Tax=Burkholderia multivorans TaxID=87883 RepID=UPI001C21A158|nr:hypothetical protein [Burkholderia multivorans]MBU9260596.1 hypothetical protein [Burkholderia multivorans]
MTLNRSNSRIVIVIRSVAAIAASGAGKPAAGQLTRPESGHFNFAQLRHYNFAPTPFLSIIMIMSNIEFPQSSV